MAARSRACSTEKRKENNNSSRTGIDDLVAGSFSGTTARVGSCSCHHCKLDSCEEKVPTAHRRESTATTYAAAALGSRCRWPRSSCPRGLGWRLKTPLGMAHSMASSTQFGGAPDKGNARLRATGAWRQWSREKHNNDNTRHLVLEVEDGESSSLLKRNRRNNQHTRRTNAMNPLRS